MTAIKSRWKQKSTGNIIHPETEVDQVADITQSAIKLLLKSATTAKAREAIECAAAVHSHQFSDLSGAAAASHSHSTGDITSFASNVVSAIGSQTLSSLGVVYSITTNGYICFGDLFGGLILQWGRKAKEDNGWTGNICEITLPLAIEKYSIPIVAPFQNNAIINFYTSIGLTRFQVSTFTWSNGSILGGPRDFCWYYVCW